MIRHRLNVSLEVWRAAVTLDDGGGQQTVWSHAGGIRGQVNQPNADEQQVAQQLGAKLSHTIHTRYGADVGRGDELDGDLPSEVRDEERLRVVAAVSDSRRTYTKLLCEIVQAS